MRLWHDLAPQLFKLSLRAVSELLLGLPYAMEQHEVLGGEQALLLHMSAGLCPQLGDRGLEFDNDGMASSPKIK
jgi:hypothetical protein